MTTPLRRPQRRIRRCSVRSALALALLLAAVGCATSRPPAQPLVDPKLAEEIDILNRLSEYLASTPPEDPAVLINSIERLMISWQREQRQGREKPLEHLVNRKVIANFDEVVVAFREGAHERQLVAAWALGFTRVPDNPLGIASRHEEALEVLVPAVQDAPDDILNNIMLALWKIGDPDTPIQPIIEIAVNHPVAELRANSLLALTSILTDQTANFARDAVLVTLTDSDPKVRLHSALLSDKYPHRLTTELMLNLLPGEETPLVRAGMAQALGASGNRAAGPLLRRMLGSPRGVERTYAHAALVEIYGVDLGRKPENWEELIPQGEKWKP
jgi:HEAT repeat protein